MSANAHAFPIRWLFEAPLGWGSVNVASARIEDIFDAWVFAARDAELALGAWAASPTHDRADAYAAYRAALDREECAAQILAAAAVRDRRESVMQRAGQLAPAP